MNHSVRTGLISAEREEQIRHPNSGDPFLLPGEAKALLTALDAARADVRELAHSLAHFATLGFGAPEKRQEALDLLARVREPGKELA